MDAKLMYFCGQCLEDQIGSVWHGYNNDTGQTLCRECMRRLK
jgi:hypothetical protein